MKPKFILEIVNNEIRLVSGKWPNKHQQLFKGEDTKGNKCEVCFDKDVGLTFYWDKCWN